MIRPVRLATVDLDRLRDQLASPTGADPAPPDGRRRREPAAPVDPGELARLREQVASLTADLADERARPQRIEQIPVLAAHDRTQLTAAVSRLRDAVAAASDLFTRLEARLDHHPVAHTSAPPRIVQPPGRGRPEPVRPVGVGTSGDHLKGGAVRMLTMLARYRPTRFSRAQLATLAGMRVTGGTFGTYLSTLRRRGLVLERDRLLEITPAGLAALGDTTTSAPATAGELRDQWRAALKAGARRMLEHLLDVYPQATTRAGLAEATGIELTGGTFGTYLSTLRRNGLVDVDGDTVRAAQILFVEPGDRGR